MQLGKINGRLVPVIRIMFRYCKTGRNRPVVLVDTFSVFGHLVQPVEYNSSEIIIISGIIGFGN